MKYSFILFLLFICNITAQDIFKGYIFSESTNMPLELANVIILGTNTGTATDEKGYFEISVPKDSKALILSYIGYENMQISLTDEDTQSGMTYYLNSKVLSSQSVLVKGMVRKKGESPVTFSNIERKEIQNNYTLQDIPEYISYLPSTTFYSEGGNGIGYNYLSIRGFDQRRISVSINGIPQNEPEDHNVYWVDLPDILESTELIQVQRGAGSGVIGYPSVGGSINIITSAFSDKPKFDFSSSFGTYNTRKYTAAFSSGLINNKYSIYAKVGQILSSGYRNGSWSKLNSYHISAVRYDENLTTQINIFGGPLSDGLVYNGLPKFVIKDKEQRKENLSYWEATDKEYTYKSVRSPNEIEEFSQPHFELLNEYKLNEDVTLNSALFMVLGEGFFDYDGSWAPFSYFRLTPENGFDITGNPDETYSSNILIRAMVKNKQWGWIPRVSFNHVNGQLIAGAEFRFHNSIHWGSINHGVGLPEGVLKEYRYYYYEGGNDIMNFFVNENWKVSEKLNVLAEAQLSYHKYEIKNEKYLGNNFEVTGIYFNPRIGFNYKFTPEFNSYLALARVTREPRLKNYYDAAESSGGAVPQFEINATGSYNYESPLVKPETMNNLEFGSTYQTKEYSLTVNLFYMFFKNEIVKKGQLDRFGQPVTGNMDETIHAGVELSASANINDYIGIIFNVTYSKNYISSGSTYLSDGIALNMENNSISGFPELIGNAILHFNYKGFQTRFSAKYLGDYYSDNYDSKLSEYLITIPNLTDYSDNKVDAYFAANLFVSYEFNPSENIGPVKMYFQVNNLFDNLYAAYAVGKEFYPAAERNVLFGIKLGL